MEKSSLFTAYLFLIFAGAFGLHRFYLDKPCTGVFYMCTGGILGIGLVYDFFTLPIQVYWKNKTAA